MYEITSIKINKYSKDSMRGYVKIVLGHNLTLKLRLFEGENGFYLKPASHKENDGKYRSDYDPSTQLLQYFLEPVLEQYNKTV